MRTFDELMSLTGKSAFVSGAGAGIGKAIAHRLAELGADLVLVDLDEEKLTETKSELSGYGPDVQTFIVDISNTDERDSLCETLSNHPPDILVNNAGIYPFRDFQEVDAEFYRHVQSTNLESVYWLCQWFIRVREKHGGVIINVSSIEALMPFMQDIIHYSISKAGVIALTRSLAKEYARHGFRVNAVVPGGIMTPGVKNTAKQIMHRRFGLLRSWSQFKGRLPVGRFGSPDEVARVVAVLATEVSSYMHGAIIPVDGGFLSA